MDKNYWYGTTVTGENVNYYNSEHFNTFLSVEPLLADLGEKKLNTRWVILGAETGFRNGKVTPEQGWIKNVVDACAESGIPLFMKNNILPYWQGKIIQQLPF